MTKVKGHATEADVEQGRVPLEDRLRNIEADTAADLGRRHPSDTVMDIRRVLVNDGELWYPRKQQLHRFMIAISQATVNHDGRGGTAADPFVWDQGRWAKQRKVGIRINVDVATLPGPLVLVRALGSCWWWVHHWC